MLACSDGTWVLCADKFAFTFSNWSAICPEQKTCFVDFQLERKPIDTGIFPASKAVFLPCTFSLSNYNWEHTKYPTDQSRAPAKLMSLCLIKNTTQSLTFLEPCVLITWLLQAETLVKEAVQYLQRNGFVCTASCCRCIDLVRNVRSHHSHLNGFSPGKANGNEAAYQRQGRAASRDQRMCII